MIAQCKNKVKENCSTKIVIILGPTASGKTDLAFKLAEKLNGEIICADSRQVYCGMDVGTAKPSKIEKKIIPHHLFDIALPNKPLNVALYKKMAEKTIKDIQKRGRIPFLVGGTGLYIKAIVDNLQFPKLKPSQKLRNNLEQKTTPELFTIYKKLDGKGASQIDKNNKRRLIRAIEVCEITGQPFWEQRKEATPLFDVLQIGIDVPKPELEKRIIKRVEKMLKLNLEKEVKALVKKYSWTPILKNTIGYAEWLQKQPSRFCRSDSVASAIILHTLQFAKRQMTWFRRDKNIRWVKNYQQAANLTKKFIFSNSQRPNT